MTSSPISRRPSRPESAFSRSPTPPPSSHARTSPMSFLFAEMSAEGWGIVVTAAFLGLGGIVTGVVKMILDHRDRVRQEQREDARVLRETEAAEKVEDVRLQAMRAAAEQRQAAKVVAGKVAEVA